MPIATKKIKVFHPNSRKLDRTIRHIRAEACIAAMKRVLGVSDSDLEPVVKGFDALEEVGGETMSLMIGERRVRLEQIHA